MGENHVHGEVVNDLVHVEILLNDLPLLLALCLAERFNKRDQLGVISVGIVLLFVLALDAILVPEDLVKVAFGFPIVSPEESAVYLLKKVTSNTPISTFFPNTLFIFQNQKSFLFKKQ